MLHRPMSPLSGARTRPRPTRSNADERQPRPVGRRADVPNLGRGNAPRCGSHTSRVAPYAAPGGKRGRSLRGSSRAGWSRVGHVQISRARYREGALTGRTAPSLPTRTPQPKKAEGRSAVNAARCRRGLASWSRVGSRFPCTSRACPKAAISRPGADTGIRQVRVESGRDSPPRQARSRRAGSAPTELHHADKRRTFEIEYRVRRDHGPYGWAIDAAAPRRPDGFSDSSDKCLRVTRARESSSN